MSLTHEFHVGIANKCFNKILDHTLYVDLKNVNLQDNSYPPEVSLDKYGPLQWPTPLSQEIQGDFLISLSTSFSTITTGQ